MARKQSFTKEKYQETILAKLNVYLRKVADPRLMKCTLTKVELNDDYSVAKVFWDSFEMMTAQNSIENSSKNFEKEEIQKAFNKASSKFRTVLAQELDVRHTPVVHFQFDSQLQDMAHIENLLKN